MGSLQYAAQFGAAFVGEAAVGVAAGGGGILGDAVAKQVNFHEKDHNIGSGML
jgi:urea transporter